MTTGIFPHELKISKVVPLFKNGDAEQIENYRPISLLSSFSKIFEYVIFIQTFAYMNNNNLLCSEQFGFRSGHSTELAALKIVDLLVKHMDNYKIPLNIYIDLSKAFDTLDHDILLSKLNYYGIKGLENKLFRSYLSDRYQYVDFKGSYSESLKMSTGVPQGSILGPLLFIIYINDLPLVSDTFKIMMYADDTTLYCNLNNESSEITINAELRKVHNWLTSNKLSLNARKTKFMVFHTDQRKVEYPKLTMNNIDIERVSYFNFLGLIVSSNLKWHNHVQHVSIQISRMIGLMYRLKYIYPQSILLMIYNTFIVPHFNYCLLIWGAKISEGHRLHLLQKKALRIITNNDYIAHTEPICKNLRLLKVIDMHRITIWKFYYKLMRDELPVYFETMKPVLPELNHRYEIRNPKFHLPVTNHEFANQLIQYQLIECLNKEVDVLLITSKVQTHSFHGYKLYLKNQVINSYNV